MKELLLKQKQVLLFIFAGALSAVVEIGSFKILSLYLPKIFIHENNFHGIHYFFNKLRDYYQLFPEYLVCF